jgi:hypothetical protein
MQAGDLERERERERERDLTMNGADGGEGVADEAATAPPSLSSQIGAVTCQDRK